MYNCLPENLPRLETCPQTFYVFFFPLGKTQKYVLPIRMEDGVR